MTDAADRDRDEREDRVLTEGGEAPDSDKAAEALDPKGAKTETPKAREDELLDEGLEETFPASDPVSAKHIT